MSNKKPQKLSVVIPVYNEKKTIEIIIARVLKANTLGLKKEIVVVDDGSTDGTKKILKKINNRNIKTYFFRKNRGKGAALRHGFKQSTGDIILVQDADLEYHPEEYPALLGPILKNEAEVVYGSRFITDRPRRVLYFWHSVGNQWLTFLSNILTNLNLTDMETCYKVFRREIMTQVLPKLTSDKFGFEPEVTALIAKLAKNNGCRIYEVGISYYGRTYKEGKKIKWIDGLLAVWQVIKFNLRK